MHSVIQDFRYALRGWRKTPGFSVAAVFTLALGIGAATAVSSVVYGVLLRPLPYHDPERLVLIRGDLEGVKSIAAFSGPEVRDLQEQATLMEAVGAVWGTSGAIEAGSELHHIRFAWVTAELLPMLGTRPTLGRLFQPEDDLPGAPPVILLGRNLWVTHFGADPEIVGKSVRLEGGQRTVIGVVPDLRLPRGAYAISLEAYDAWTPQTYWTDRNLRWLRVLARLKPDTTPAQAQSQLDGIASRLQEQHAEYANTGIRLHAQPLHGDLVREVRPALLATAAGALGILLAHWGIELLLALRPANLPRLEDIRVDATVMGLAIAVSLVTALLFGAAPAQQSLALKIQDALKGVRGGGGRGGRLRRLLVVAEVTLSLVLLIGAGLMLRSFSQLRNVNPGFEPERALTIEAPLAGRDHQQPEDRWRFYTGLSRSVAALNGVEAVRMPHDADHFRFAPPFFPRIDYDRQLAADGIAVAPGQPGQGLIHDDQVVRQGLGLILAGLALGLAAAVGLTHFLSSLLFGVTATDPATCAAVALLLAAAGLLACYLPARRAAGVDPLKALRYE